ncbi:MAG: PaaI family thioesterase [Christensenellaceae bacterium]|nr:PaaI family thioesterase [Christensenellaceae bacterium]
MTLSELKKHLADDPFARSLGIRLIELEPGHARTEMPAEQGKNNFFGTTHGGALFSLADATAGMAITACGVRAVTASASIHYLRPVTGGTICCESRLVHLGSRTGVMETTLKDDCAHTVAIVSLSFIITDTLSPDGTCALELPGE